MGGRRLLAACVAMAGMTATMAGCAGPRASAGAAFNSQGMPDERFIVASGPVIEYRPPMDGVVVLVDRRWGKVLLSRWLAEGSLLEVDPESSIDASLRKAGLITSKAADMEYLVYFVPAATTQPAKP